MSFETLNLSIGSDGVGRVVLDRPDVRNAFNEQMIDDIYRAFRQLSADETARLVTLTGAGKAFSAGADLSMMQAVAAYSEQENVEEGLRLAAMLQAVHECPKPTVALVNGPAIGGGVGLVAACDIAIASSAAVFAFSEVRLGLIPAVISPFVLSAIGARQAQRYFLTAERFGADEAARIGLVHRVVDAEALTEAGADMVKALLACGPKAQAAAKALIMSEAGAPIDAEQRARLAQSIAGMRASAEGQDGIGAFLEKRKPTWMTGS
ncbi:MAG: enoyl-CoA hydratase-related protein [Pseudomonadota bacterium]